MAHKQLCEVLLCVHQLFRSEAFTTHHQQVLLFGVHVILAPLLQANAAYVSSLLEECQHVQQAQQCVFTTLPWIQALLCSTKGDFGLKLC